MKVKEIIRVLEDFCPQSYAVEWDNVGLHVGRMEAEVTKVYLTLDIDEEAIAAAIENGAGLIISHHPLLFHGIRQANDQSLLGNRVVTMIENKIAGYCMHTNFDVKGGMAQEAACRLGLADVKVLELTSGDFGIGCVGTLPAEMSLTEFCQLVKEAFHLDYVEYYGNAKKRLRKVAIVPGSGKDDIEPAQKAGADVFLSGDMTYHYAIDTVAGGMAIVDAGHYGLEHVFMDIIRDVLARELPDLEVLEGPRHNPRRVI